MSEKAPATNYEEINDIVTVDDNGKGHRPDGKFLSKQNMELIAEHQDKIRDGLAELDADSGFDQPENAGARKNSARNSSNTPTSGELRGVEDGEYGDEYLRLPQNSDPEDPDYLPVGVMAHEPWTFDEVDDAQSRGGENNPGNNGNDGEGSGSGNNNGGENAPGTDIEHVPNPNNGTGNGSETDPRVRIGEAVEKRMNELMEGGMSESDAHAQAHDEFWGGDVHEGNGNGGEETPPELGPGEDGGELVQLPEVDPQMVERLELARTRYAELTAKSRRSYLGRFLKQDTQVGGILAKIPGVKKAAEKWNNFKASDRVQNAASKLDSLRAFNAETEAAKQEYEEAYTKLSEATAAELERVGWEEDVVRSLSLIGNIEQDKLLEQEIVEQRESQSRSTNTFVNWWVNQQGLKGKLLKAGSVVIAGGLTGLTAGIFAGAAAAFIGGGAAGLGIGKHVTGRRANAVVGVDQEGQNVTLAGKQSYEDRAVKEAEITASHALDGKGSVEDITKSVEGRTDEEMLGNRRRVKTATALGAAAGKGAFKLKELFDRPDAQPETPKKPTPEEPPKPPTPEEPPKPPTPEEPPTPEINGRIFNVEQGNGFTHEIQDFAVANGKQVDAQKAFDIYNEAVARFGQDGLIEPIGTYVRDAGDIGISAPGGAAWKPGVAEFINSRL